MEQIIRHSAIVKAVEGESVKVTIVQSSACSSCVAKRMCNSSEAKEKEVEVITSDAASYRAGQKVLLEGLLSDGRAAALIAYGLPLLLMLPTLFLGIYLTGSETQGALWSLLTLVLYYLFVYLFLRKRLQQRFSFRIKH
ncbi:MAG: SoxR reducing system RseC family protein [Bacteroidaceae bacterium]|nr:SoxR reducing system RseC family protein [Bacteroidaceae bacterium]